ncbi:MAG: helix-turn-helix transcriptional regulator [Ilumatobacter sp.]
MRADRLVATLLLLQARGTVTAAQVADELEVSERTARRDLDALAVAGIPVYSRQGRGGGWTLVGGATTDLTGLRSPEARALMTMAAAAGQATPDFASALAKLTQAMPDPVRREAERAVASVVSDPTTWGDPDSLLAEPTRDEWREPLQAAVLDHRRIELAYDTPRTGRSVRYVDPLGLVVKRGVWYLLADTANGHRSFRLDRVEGFTLTGDTFEPPAEFDLGAAWSTITERYGEQATRVKTSAIVTSWSLGPLRALGVETVVDGDASDGRLHVTLGARSNEILGAQIAGLIDHVELIEPDPKLVEFLGEVGRQLVSRYGEAAAR